MIGLSEKQARFCYEYVNNGYNGIEAYLTAYNTTNRQTAYTESRELLKLDKITAEINRLKKPYDNEAKNDRYKKIRILWDIIENKETKNSDRLTAIQILNKMQGDNGIEADSELDNFNKISTEKLLTFIG